MFDETHSHESPIGFLGDFEEAVQTPQPIDPGEGTFNFPALATISFLVPFFSGHLVEGTLRSCKIISWSSCRLLEDARLNRIVPVREDTMRPHAEAGDVFF